MANTYDTSNEPLGSTAVKVLYNNTSNLDDAVNSDSDTWVDRPPFGRIRRTWRGMENSFDSFLANTAFELPPLVYVDGTPLQVDRATQLIQRGGLLYSVRLPASLPLTLSGNWATDEPKLTVRTDQSLRQDLYDNTDPSKGGTLVGFKRTSMSGAVRSVSDMLSVSTVSVWEFESFVTNKPDVDDPSTWDWTPAFQAAADSVAAHSVFPEASLNLRVPAPYKYRLTSVDFGFRVNLHAGGAILAPFDNSATETHLIRFAGFNRVCDVVVDMEYALNYESAIWMRGRHSHFFGCTVWKARYAWMYGNPAWQTDPSQGGLGDSENAMHGCESIWCITAVKAYGQNTILHFNDCFMYTYRNAMAEFDPTNPNLPTWNALEEKTFINCGALIYLNGGAVANFTGVSPVFFSQLQPVDDPALKNSFGKFYGNGVHIESGYLFSVDSVGVYTADDTTSRCLELHGCHGYQATTAGHRINLGGDCQQGVWVEGCNFYGPLGGNNILYSAAGTAKVYVDPESFRNITSDFFQGLHCAQPVNYPSFCMANVVSSAQTVTSTLQAIVMPTREDSDVWVPFEDLWYSTSTGVFTARSNIRSFETTVGLTYPSGAATDATTFVLLVDGIQKDIQVAYGPSPKAVLNANRVNIGQNVVVQAACSTSRALSGLPNTRMIVRGSV